MPALYYQDTATFYEVSPSGYANNKNVVSHDCVPVIFMQGVGFDHSNFQEGADSDASCFVDPTDPFIVDHHYRLEGMYVLAPMFNADDIDGWYKVTKVTIFRDILLGNEIDNVQVLLKKTTQLPGVS